MQILFYEFSKGDHVKEYLDYQAIAKLADEADEPGYFEFDLQGGELYSCQKNYLKFWKQLNRKDFICI